MVPEFAIGQRALLIESADGNAPWDCISLIDLTPNPWIDRGRTPESV
jgi:hypothetical protein